MKQIFLFGFLAGVVMAGGPVMPCEALGGRAFGKEVTIASARAVAASEKLPAHCDVRGVIPDDVATILGWWQRMEKRPPT